MSAHPRLRLATEDDAEGVLAIYAPLVLHTAISFELAPPSLEEMKARIRSTLAEWPWLVVEDEAPPSLLGYAYARPFRARPAYQWTVESTVYVHPRAQGRGVGGALYATLLTLLRSAGYRSVVGAITLPNPPSVALHERLGFRHLGTFPAAGFKLGRWHDLGFWRTELRGDGPPDPPRPLPALLARPEWEAALRAGEGKISGHTRNGGSR
jgi:phosphinothricin acetyltransferase